MASGRLGAADLSAATYTTLYTVPASVTATVNLSFCNRNGNPVTVRASVSAASGTPSNSEFIEYESVIPANGVLERSGIVMDTTKVLTVYASSTGVSAVAWGYEG